MGNDVEAIGAFVHVIKNMNFGVDNLELFYCAAQLNDIVFRQASLEQRGS